MCGIVGMLTNTVANDKQLKLMSHLLYLDQMRGEHATGVAKVDLMTGVATTIKKAMSAIEFLNEDDVNEFFKKDRKRLYIGHNRFATMGARDDAGAHPFTYKHITMVHNGTVDHWVMKDLTGHGRDKVTVDSEMVCHTIADLGIKEAVKKFSGAFSLVWWDSQERTLNFLRNEKRPMFIAHTNECMMWSSEKAFIEVLVDRDKTMTYNVKPYQTEPHLHYCWKFNQFGTIENKGRPTVTKLKFTDRPNPNPVRVNYNWGMGNDLPFYNYGQQGGQVKNSNVIYSKDGVHLGTQMAVDRMNEALEEMGTKVRAGDRLTINITGFETWAVEKDKENPRGNVIGQLNIHGREPVEVVCYNQYKSDILNDDGTMFEVVAGTIESARATPMVCKGVRSVQEKIILVNLCQSIADPKFSKNKSSGIEEKKKDVFKIFPLQVDGVTFKNQQEFLDFSSQGCSACGNIPTAHDHRNNKMFVYSVTKSNDIDLKHAEFICGGCILEDEKVQVNKE